MSDDPDDLIGALGSLALGEEGPSSPQIRKHYMYPQFHDAVVGMLGVDDMRFMSQDTDTGTIESYDTNIMGCFDCTKPTCSTKRWSSKKVAITIRMYPGMKYNARVYNQRCKQCKALGVQELDEECYAERVTYRLKKWLGYRVIRPTYIQGNTKGPHQSALCEGCKAGHCKEGLE
jgi:hypothetical protein